MNLLLESLIQEYKDLRVKLDKVSDLIKMYGGEIPDIAPSQGPAYTKQSTTKVRGVEYPKNGTWKDKILFVLRAKEEPITAKEIAAAIEALEGFMDHDAKDAGLNTSHILKTVTQYTSTMGKASEIGVDDGAFRNKYFLNS